MIIISNDPGSRGEALMVGESTCLITDQALIIAAPTYRCPDFSKNSIREPHGNTESKMGYGKLWLIRALFQSIKFLILIEHRQNIG